MTQRGKGSPDQIGFVVVGDEMRTPDPTRDEAYRRDRQQILDTRHDRVEAFCRHRGLAAPTSAHWRNAQEVLTFLVYRRTARGIIVEADDIAANAFPPRGSSKSRERSPATVTRALRLLRDLAVLSSAYVGDATAYSIDFDRLAEIRSTVAPAQPAQTPQAESSESRHRSVTESSSQLSNDDSMTTRRRPDDDSDYYPPFLSQTTTPINDDDSDWRAVEAEVFACGVRAAKTAIDIVRGVKRDPRRPELVPNASAADVRAVVAFWKANRHAWKDSHTELYLRILAAQPELPPHEGWSPMLESQETKLDRERRESEREAALRRQSREHWEYQEREAEKRRQREQDPGAIRRMLAEHCPELARRLERERPLSEPGHQPRPPPVT